MAKYKFSYIINKIPNNSLRCYLNFGLYEYIERMLNLFSQISKKMDLESFLQKVMSLLTQGISSVSIYIIN